MLVWVCHSRYVLIYLSMSLHFNQELSKSITIVSITFAESFLLMDALNTRHLWSSPSRCSKIPAPLLLEVHWLFAEWCNLGILHGLPVPLPPPTTGERGGQPRPHLWLVLITQTSGNHLSALRHTNRMIYRPGLCVFLNLILIYLKWQWS